MPGIHAEDGQQLLQPPPGSHHYPHNRDHRDCGDLHQPDQRWHFYPKRETEVRFSGDASCIVNGPIGNTGPLHPDLLYPQADRAGTRTGDDRTAQHRLQQLRRQQDQRRLRSGRPLKVTNDRINYEQHPISQEKVLKSAALLPLHPAQLQLVQPDEELL